MWEIHGLKINGIIQLERNKREPINGRYESLHTTKGAFKMCL